MRNERDSFDVRISWPIQSIVSDLERLDVVRRIHDEFSVPEVVENVGKQTSVAVDEDVLRVAVRLVEARGFAAERGVRRLEVVAANIEANSVHSF